MYDANNLRRLRAAIPENREKERKRSREYYWEDVEESRRRSREKYHINKARYKKRRQSPASREQVNRQHSQVKAEVLTHYGFGKCACVRCGFNDLRALTIDHIEGRNGSKDKYGLRLYRQLKASGYPPGYITLCMNCQFIKRVQAKEYN